MWYIHTIEYSLAFQKEILQYATIQMNLKDIMLSEIISHRKTNILWFQLCGASKTVELPAAKNSMVVARGRGRGEKQSC